jgi:acylphosphatase
VECLAQGSSGALESLLADLRRGPGMAEIDSVDVDWRPPVGGLNGFQVRG